MSKQTKDDVPRSQAMKFLSVRTLGNQALCPGQHAHLLQSTYQGTSNMNPISQICISINANSFSAEIK